MLEALSPSSPMNRKAWKYVLSVCHRLFESKRQIQFQPLDFMPLAYTDHIYLFYWSIFKTATSPTLPLAI